MAKLPCFLRRVRCSRSAMILMLAFLSASSHVMNAQDSGVAKPLGGFSGGEYQMALARAVRASAQRVLPSVVSVEVIGVSAVAPGKNNASEVSQDASSCGIVVDREGYIVASEIVVRRPSASILVVLPDETRLAAKVVARDHHRGLVMLKVAASSDLQPLEMPDQIEVPVGATVVAVGRYGGDRSPMVSSGIFSASGRLEGTMIQCDARVSPSFYGGPLVDLYGNAIGILVPAVASGGAPDDTSWYDSGIAFAVPTPVLKNKLDRLREGTDIRKGLIGIVPKTKDPYAEGTELAAVRNRSPAEKAGIKPGDSVESVNGQSVKMFQQIKQALGPHDAGETIELGIRSGESSRRVSVTLAETIPPLQPQRLGIWIESVADSDSSDDGGDEKEPSGVRILGVVPSTPAEGELEVGDVITSVSGVEIGDVSTITRQLVTAVSGEALEIDFLRDGVSSSVTLVPTPVAAETLGQTIGTWADQRPENKWDVQKLRLPDVPNLAAYVAPPAEDASSVQGLGMLVLLLPPDKRDPEQVLEAWRDAAGRNGVVICAVCSEDEKRWQQKEIDVVSRMATMMAQRVPVAVSSIASTGVLKDVKASAADSMVVAIALSDRKNFGGIAVSEQTRPPAVRLRENEPDRALEVLLPIESLDDGPTWLAPLAAAGYPISLGGEMQMADLLRWARLLQTI